MDYLPKDPSILVSSVAQHGLNLNFHIFVSLICCQNDESADADIGIDDVTEDAIGDMFEDVGTHYCADNDTAEAIEIVKGYSSCEEAVVGSYTRHH